MSSDEPIILNAYSCSASSGIRFLGSKQERKANIGKKDESDLLKSIRAAFHGSGKEPDPPFRSMTSPAVDGQEAEEELAWDENTVVFSTGGVLRYSWNFEEEGQRVQYACFGWLLTEGTVHSGSHGSGSAGHYVSNEDDDLSSPATTEQKPERDAFSPFFRARKARMRTVEPTTISYGVFIFLRSFGKIYLMNGLEYSFSLPFIVRRAWPLSPHGVLLQRVVEPAELDEPDPLPSLYSLTNPFQEPRPVGVTENIKGGHGFSPVPAEIAEHELEGGARNIHAEEQVVWIAPRPHDTSDSDNIIATLNGSRNKLSLWRYVFIPPKAIPTANPSTVQGPANRHGPLPGEKAHGQMRMTSHSGKDMVARSDRIREPSPDFEPSQPEEFGEMPPLSALPGMAPTLDSATTLASLASAGSSISQWPSSAPSRARRNSSSRNDLTSTMDRMVLSRHSDAQIQGHLPIVNQSILPVYWVERLYEHELNENE